MNVGDCLQVNFTNLLAPDPADVNSFAANNAPATRTASAHIMGLQLVGSILSDGSNVGQNQSSLVNPGSSTTYTYFAVENKDDHTTVMIVGNERTGLWKKAFAMANVAELLQVFESVANDKGADKGATK